MFNADFYPTPKNVIEIMLEGENIKDKIILEPSAGKGDIVNYLQDQGAKNVIACENNADLRKIVESKCKVLANDFLSVKSDQISHIDYIVMNPPFSNADAHILHAFKIAPAGCRIIALCNLSTIENLYTGSRKELKTIIDSYGSYEDLGDCFSDSERKTGVEVALIRLQKANSADNTNEFEGFFMEDEPEDAGENGIMKFDAVRDIVQRYVNSVKCFDEHEIISRKMNSLTSSFKTGSFGFSCGYDKVIYTREDFCKEIQRSAWNSIFNKLNLTKHTTQGVRDDINKFIETQQKVPFTMKNIYHMINIIFQTRGQQMDKAILEVFDKVTMHHNENRHNVEGWKTNSHYLLNKRFIAPRCVEVGWRGEVSKSSWSTGNFEKIEDLLKALCYISGDNYSNFISLDNFISYKFKLVDLQGNHVNDKSYDFDVKMTASTYDELNRRRGNDYPNTEIVSNDIEFGKWFDWAYFKVRAYKKGTLHIEFKDEKLWGEFNQRVAKLKGYPLYEYKAPTKKEAPIKPNNTNNTPYKPVILATIKLKAA